VSELPKGWVKVKIEDIAEVKGGKRLPKGHELLNERTNYPYIRVTDFTHGTVGLTKIKYIDEYTHSYIKNYTISQDDLYISIAGTIGLVGQIPSELNNANLTENAAKISGLVGVDKRYLSYVLSSEIGVSQFNDKITSSGQPKLALFRIRECEFPLTPLNEQIRIANKLDSILAKVDKAQARLDKIPAILKRFRQSVLAAATSGELTQPGFTSSEWRSVKLIDLVETRPRNGKSPKGVDFDTGVKNLTLSAITPGYFVENKYKFVDLDVPTDSHLWLKNQDILIQRANSIEYVGVSALYEGEDDQYIYPDLIMKCRANERVLSKYLYYALSSEPVRKYFRDNATGTTGNMPKINQAVVSAAPINLPKIDEQKIIVDKVESLFNKADKVEKQYLDAKSRLDRLTQSILAKAFRGELVPQDPSDEPAEQLLERILKEREQAKPKKMTRKRVTKAKTVEKG
jgi:type I restriction enzyme, S subunit